MSEPSPLLALTPGMPIVVGGNKVVTVSDELAAAFQPGDHLMTVARAGDLLHIPAAEFAHADRAVGKAAAAFDRMGATTDAAITAFFGEFADRLADDATFAAIAAANEADVAAAQAKGRSTTRLVLSDTMRADMISGLRTWAEAPSGRGEVVDVVTHDGWTVEQVRAGLGVVGFVFEGRPNVFADACGVIRSGNTVVFRIGSDALGTALAIVEHALDPALKAAGLPEGAASLVESPAHAAGWAMFADTRLALAVARGSGKAVAQLGAVAQQAGNPVSLHGTGGAWIIAAPDAAAEQLASAVRWSLDRKVCNTLNTLCLTADAAAEQLPVALDALKAAADARGSNPKVHILAGHEGLLGAEWFADTTIARAEGDVTEPGADPIAADGLGIEWEWENSPEISIAICDTVDSAIDLFNAHSPHFVVSVISSDDATQQHAFDRLDAPFVGNGFTRWVDGQYALDRPELGLSNWENGRLFGRGGVLSGDSVYTVRVRVTQTDPDVHR